jgi:hypothetical protein
MSQEGLKGWLIWRRIGKELTERVLRLNPDPTQGFKLRGLNLAPTVWSVADMHDVRTRADFDAEYGKGAYGRLKRSEHPSWAFMSGGGKRRWVSRNAEPV